ncbi:MAG: chloride channel protein [Acidobacteria bacterium]|nr:chloride channel protein [Acidobacteriota bacterium]
MNPFQHGKRFTLSEGQRFLLLAILIGMFSGLMVVAFHIMIDLISWNSLGALSGTLRYGRLISPALGALVATYLATRVFPAARGSGVNQTKAALYISDGFVDPSTVPGKFLACSIAIGSGNSLGPEDPSLQMGAGVASMLGRIFHLGRKNMRLIAPVGAAAGIAAAFNTPITGVLFVMEEVVASWNAGVVGSIVLAAVSSVVVVRWFLGDEPLFRIPALQFQHPSELLVYAAIGVVGGLLSAGFIRLIEVLHNRLKGLPHRTQLIQALCGGLLCGFVGLWLPEVMGAGYDAIDFALHGRFPWDLLLILAGAKLLVTLICFSTGVPGGMFAPTLFVGAMLGGGLAGLAHHYSSLVTSPLGAYVLVGMGTFFSGVFRAPMTSIFMVFETSASYVIILPVMIANTISYFISRRLHPVPFFTMLARQEGIDLPSAEEYRSTEVLRVEDAMQPLPEGMTLEQAPPIYPDVTLDAALRLLADHALLCVVSRANPQVPIGVVSILDVRRAYGFPESGPILPETPEASSQGQGGRSGQ